MDRRTKSGLCIALTALCCFARVPAGAQTYTITDLGTAESDTVSVPYGLNNLGEAVGLSETPGSDLATLFSNGTTTVLEMYAVAFGINSGGEIVGEGPPKNSSGNFDAFLYSDGVITDINSRAVFPYGSSAAAINTSGQVVGTGYPSAAQGPPFHAFVYSGGKMTDIGPPGAYEASAVGINDSGQVIGGYSLNSGASGAFLYSNGKFATLALPSGASAVEANAINNAGQIVGEVFPTSGAPCAAMYINGKWTDLGVIAGAQATTATGINSSGQVVGIAYFPMTVYHPPTPGKHVIFIVRNGAPVDLNTLIPANSGFTIGGYSREGYSVGNVSINDSGQILCTAEDPAKQNHAILLTPK